MFVYWMLWIIVIVFVLYAIRSYTLRSQSLHHTAAQRLRILSQSLAQLPPPEDGEEGAKGADGPAGVGVSTTLVTSVPVQFNSVSTPANIWNTTPMMMDLYQQSTNKVTLQFDAKYQNASPGGVYTNILSTTSVIPESLRPTTLPFRYPIVVADPDATTGFNVIALTINADGTITITSTGGGNIDVIESNSVTWNVV